MYNKGIRKIGQRNRSDAMIRGNVVFAFFTAHHLLQSLITWPVEQIQRLFPIIATNCTYVHKPITKTYHLMVEHFTEEFSVVTFQ